MQGVQQSLRFFLFTFFLLNLHLISSVDSAAADDADFIRSSCSVTLYPDVCYSSLASYASSVQQDPGQLAQAAISVGLTKAKEMAAFVSNITQGAVAPASGDTAGDRRTSSAIKDCTSNLRDSIDEMKKSIKQMQQLGSTSNGGTTSQESFKFQMSNVQTWMSAALTDEDTCTDGLPDGQVKMEVSDRATELKKMTSNALALVNSYVNKQQ